MCKVLQTNKIILCKKLGIKKSSSLASSLTRFFLDAGNVFMAEHSIMQILTCHLELYNPDTDLHPSGDATQRLVSTPETDRVFPHITF